MFRGVRSEECGVRYDWGVRGRGGTEVRDMIVIEEGGCFEEDAYGLQFTVYGLQMITVQAIRFVYSLKFIVYR